MRNDSISFVYYYLMNKQLDHKLRKLSKSYHDLDLERTMPNVVYTNRHSHKHTHTDGRENFLHVTKPS